jgi:hypothetical protein
LSPRHPPGEAGTSGATAGPAFDDTQGELVALRCTGCGAYLPVGQLPGAARAAESVHSAHINQEHGGCLRKGTWRAEYQLSLSLGALHG